MLVFSEAVTVAAGSDSWLAVDELTPDGVVVIRVLTQYYTPETSTTMVCSNGNLTLTVALQAVLLKFETRYADDKYIVVYYARFINDIHFVLYIFIKQPLRYVVVISPTLIYDLSPRPNAFAGLTHGEWQFTTQSGPIITNSSLKLDSNPGLGSTSLALGSTKAGTVIQFRGMRLLDFGWPTLTYGPYGCKYIS